MHWGLFQLKVVDSEQIYACNVCDQGFDGVDKIMKRIVDDHKDIIIKIIKDMENKEEDKFNDESGGILG